MKKVRDPFTQIARSNRRGKQTRSRINDIRKNMQKSYNFFPRIEAHYCRAKTKRQYLERTRTIPKIYED